jgi:triosephosphate isomerase
MTRREIFAGNWKMYKTSSEAEALVKALLAGIGGLKKGREVVLFPPSPLAARVASLCAGSSVDVGMQNMYFEDEGAFTGEVSPLMVRDAGCRYILIGHSERRHVFGESDHDVNRKVHAALRHGLEPMICVGELLDEREKGVTRQVVERQIRGALEGVSAAEMARVLIAYEPVWAIGTGKVATPEIAQEVHAEIRSFVAGLYDKAVAESLPILYGGSVKPDNISGLMSRSDIDGVLVGGASLKADSFLGIVLG